jgi:outer membrane protein
MSKNKIVAFSFFAALLACVSARADDNGGFQAGDSLLRLRAIGIIPDVTSSTSIGGYVDASNSVRPELDYSYFFTNNIAVEAIAAITTHHMSAKDTSLGYVNLGHTTLLPPTVTAQYHFLSNFWVNPYLGAGINYTFFFNDGIPASSAAKNINYENNVGAALQAGADFHLAGSWYANFDVKHIFLNTEVSINNGAIKANVNLDPTIVGVGIGYKF